MYTQASRGQVLAILHTIADPIKGCQTNPNEPELLQRRTSAFVMTLSSASAEASGCDLQRRDPDQSFCSSQSVAPGDAAARLPSAIGTPGVGVCL